MMNRYSYSVMQYGEAMRGFIRRYWLEHGYGPEVREVQEGLNISSSSVTSYNLEKLVEAGLVLWDKKRARTIRLPEMQISFGERNEAA